MSDIHGQYDRFQNLLHQLNLQKEDKLYILGDVVDRGPHPMKILQYMMKHQNIIPIIGNHEVMALPNLKLLVPEISKDFLQGLSPEEYQNFAQWTLTGGTDTIQDFRKLPTEERRQIMGKR
jgi:metallophosphoesterase